MPEGVSGFYKSMRLLYIKTKRISSGNAGFSNYQSLK